EVVFGAPQIAPDRRIQRLRFARQTSHRQAGGRRFQPRPETPRVNGLYRVTAGSSMWSKASTRLSQLASRVLPGKATTSMATFRKYMVTRVRIRAVRGRTPRNAIPMNTTESTASPTSVDARNRQPCANPVRPACANFIRDRTKLLANSPEK